jgi:nitrogen fixation protein NifU and related proteins
VSVDDLYEKVIRKHHRRPRNKVPCPECDLRVSQDNPLCGDEIELALRFDQGTIARVTFQGQGCMISQASASMMSEAVHGLSIAAAFELIETVHELVHGKPPSVDLGEVMALAGVVRFPTRVKCALLPWFALKDALIRVTSASG